MTSTQQAWRGSTSSDVASQAGATAGHGKAPRAFESRPEASAERSEAFDAGVEEIRKRFGSDLTFLFPRLEDRLARRLGFAPRSPRAAALAGLTGVGLRLAAALLATALVGDWTGIPWGRWAAILVYFGVFDATQPWRTPPLDVPLTPTLSRMAGDWRPLVPTIAGESDLQDLIAFTRRWERLRVAGAAGAVVATLMLGAGWLFTPIAMTELSAGSIVLLGFLLYDFGALMVYGNLYERAFMARQARYDHRLFWPSPADSTEIRKAMQMWNVRALAFWITVYLVLSVLFVSWSSPLVTPLAVGFIVIGYSATLVAAFGTRTAVRKIIERSRDQRLAVLRDRIDAFESRFADLSAEESRRLQDLLSLHNTIRDAPATITTTHAAAWAATRLIVPTIVFVITVFGEVSAERFLDAILP